MKDLEKKITRLPILRKKPVKLLKAHLTNPGRFSVLVLGDRGTGKQHWINEITLNQTHSIKSYLTEETVDYWDDKLKHAHETGGILIIKDIEFLTKKSQTILFDALSTTDGRYGIKEKCYKVRIVFTSSLSINQLRDTEKYLYHYFFDRIAQLVVEIPNFNDYGTDILADFETTWLKYNFQGKKTAKPDFKELNLWLATNAHRFHGNFRDLDKICINWDNYRRMGKEDSEILNLVKSDFKKYYHFPEKSKHGTFKYDFNDELSYHELIKNFKKQLKDWSIDKFGNKKDAAKKLGLSYRTMEGW